MFSEPQGRKTSMCWEPAASRLVRSASLGDKECAGKWHSVLHGFYFILYFCPTCISSISLALRNVSGPKKCILLFANFPPSFRLWRALDRILHSGIPSGIFTNVSVSSSSQSRTPPGGLIHSSHSSPSLDTASPRSWPSRLGV